LERESRGENFPVSDRFNIDNNSIDKGFVEVFNEFISIVDTFHNHELKEVNLIQTYKNIGKMELINCLIDDKSYRDLLSIGKEKLNKYIKCDG